MKTYINSDKVMFVDCTPDNDTTTWNIASPNKETLDKVMEALWAKTIKAKTTHA